MKVEFLGTFGGNTESNYLTSFFIDDHIAVDAGSLTQALSLERQLLISDILISHSHLDHTLSLPFLADNIFGEREEPLRIWAHPTVINALRRHIFNEVTWPDFSVLPNPEQPTLQFCPLESSVTVTIGGLRVTPVPVNHVVPTHGFMIECPNTNASILYSADTTTTDQLWQLANGQSNLKAIVVDCSFPNDFESLAKLSGHMTPDLLRQDLTKLKRDCQILIYHLKPMYKDVLLAELGALGIDNLKVDLQGQTFHW